MSDQDDNHNNDGSPNPEKPVSSVPNPFAKPAATGVTNPFAKPMTTGVPNPFAQPHAPMPPVVEPEAPVFGQKPTEPAQSAFPAPSFGQKPAAPIDDEFSAPSFGSKPATIDDEFASQSVTQSPAAPVEEAAVDEAAEAPVEAPTNLFQFAPRSYDEPAQQAEEPVVEEPSYVQEPTLSDADFAPRSYDTPAQPAEEPAYVQEPTLSDADFAPRSYESPAAETVPATDIPSYTPEPVVSDADFAPRAEVPAYNPEPQAPVYTPAPQPEPEAVQSFSAVSAPQFSSVDEDDVQNITPDTAMEAPVAVNLAGDRLKDLRKELAAHNKENAAPQRSKKGALIGVLLILLGLAGGGAYFLLSGDDATNVTNNTAAPAQIAEPQPDAGAGLPPVDTTQAAPTDDASTAALQSLCDAEITATDNANGQCTINAQTVPCDVYTRYQESGFLDFCVVTARNGSQGEAIRLRQAAQQQDQTNQLQQSANAKKTAWDLCGQTITKFDKQGASCLLNDIEVPCQHFDYYQAHPTTPFYCGEKK